MKLLYKDSRIVTLTKYPGEDATTQVLKVRSLLTRTLAEQLKCRDLCFAENQVPRRFGNLTLKGQIENCEVTLPCGSYLGEVGHFNISRAKEAEKTDISLEVTYTIHFSGQIPLAEWMEGQNKDEFDLTMKPPKEWNAQQELAFEEKADAEEEEDGDDADGGAPLASAVVAAGGTHQRKRGGRGKVIDVVPEQVN